jgi:SNF2 family DNA or RNA helicase
VLSEEARATYDAMERDLVLSIKDEEITAQNAAVLTGKLLQLANGAIYTDEHKVERLHTCKVEMLQTVIEAANGQQVLVFYNYKHDLTRIKERFPEAVVLQDAIDVKLWNEHRIQILLAHPASAGHGLNLQSGGHIIVWFGLPWSLELYQQANARLHRQGQREPVTIHHLVTKDTVDEDVLKVLTGKAARQDDLIDAVKARIDRYDS